MKNVFGKFALAGLSVLTFGLCTGQAQIMNRLDFKVSQPFTVANTTLAAGSYIIRPVPGPVKRFSRYQVPVETTVYFANGSTEIDAQYKPQLL